VIWSSDRLEEHRESLSEEEGEKNRLRNAGYKSSASKGKRTARQKKGGKGAIYLQETGKKLLRTRLVGKGDALASRRREKKAAEDKDRIGRARGASLNLL